MKPHIISFVTIIAVFNLNQVYGDQFCQNCKGKYKVVTPTEYGVYGGYHQRNDYDGSHSYQDQSGSTEEYHKDFPMVARYGGYDGDDQDNECDEYDSHKEHNGFYEKNVRNNYGGYHQGTSMGAYSPEQRKRFYGKNVRNNYGGYHQGPSMGAGYIIYEGYNPNNECSEHDFHHSEQYSHGIYDGNGEDDKSISSDEHSGYDKHISSDERSGYDKNISSVERSGYDKHKESSEPSEKEYTKPDIIDKHESQSHEIEDKPDYHNDSNESEDAELVKRKHKSKTRIRTKAGKHGLKQKYKHKERTRERRVYPDRSHEHTAHHHDRDGYEPHHHKHHKNHDHHKDKGHHRHILRHKIKHKERKTESMV